MTLSTTAAHDVENFISDWQATGHPMAQVFVTLKESLARLEASQLTFNPRPGVSYSLRGQHPNQQQRDLFVMVDVIDEDPEDRWLSVCFYGDMITDPEEAGELIPGGLAGSDGYCFNLFSDDESEVEYIAQRIAEAHGHAANG